LGATFFGHPRGLATLFFTEMWERFTYYGMRAVLVLFLVAAVSQGGLGIDDKTATAIYGLYTAGVYLASLPVGAPPPADLLVNLADRLPEHWERYPRIAEIIDADEERRRLGRERFKSYRDGNVPLETHQLGASAQE